MSRSKKLRGLLGSASQQRSAIRSFKAKANARRSRAEKIADWITAALGTVSFLSANAFLFAIWILWNTGHIPGLEPVDPFPFSLLTTVVSLEAIFLAIIVLVSQNREARVTDIREEVELYINTYAENEITKVIYLLTLLAEKHGIDLSQDADLADMLKDIESEEIEKEIEKQLSD